MKNYKRIIPALSVLGLLAGAAQISQAQDSASQAQDKTGQPVSNTSSGGYIDEIFVTARKRVENIQDTPISITAFGAEALEARQIVNVGQIADFTPNLTINTSAAFSGSSSTPAIFLRGVGQVDFSLNTDPGVGLYVDGVYISRAVGGLIDLVDVERIEVLRGPQGTLFGRNTIGGAINVTSKAPTDEFGGRVKLTTGSGNRMQLQGLLNMPLGENVSSRIAVNYHKRDGYVDRPDGVSLGDDNSFSTRATIAFTPSDRWSITLSGDYTREREESAPFILTRIDPGAPFAGFHNAVIAPLLDPSLAIPPPGPPSACFIPTTSNPACFNAASVSVGVPGINQGTLPSMSNLDVYGLSLTAQYDVNDNIQLKSITAYRDLDSQSSNEPDSAPVAINSTSDSYIYNQFSQEFQLLGTSFGNQLEWILGAFYFTEEGTNANLVNFSVIEILSGGNVQNQSIAGFGQATWSLTDRLDITAGLRWTEDQRDFTPNQRVLRDIATGIPNGTPLLPNVTASTSTSDLTPHASINYALSDAVTTYATYSQGFKSGGFTQRVFPPVLPAPGQNPADVIPSFNPETVNTFEAGIKSQLFDRRLQLNAAAFTTDYSDMQVNVQIGIAPTTQNAAAATIKGFEFEAIAALSEALRLNMGVGYLDAGYDQLDAGVVGITLASKLPGTSEWTVNGGASYSHDMNDLGSLTARADFSYRSEFFFDANNEVGEDGYTIINLSINWDSANGDWRASIFGTNIGDEVYGLAGASILNPGGFQQTLFARPAEWGISLTRNF